MSYRLAAHEDPEAALPRILLEETDAAIAEAVDPDLDPSTAIHQVRKRCKRARGALQLFRGALPARRDTDARFRDAARRLGHLRDATAIREALDEAVGEAMDQGLRARAEPVRRALRRREARARDDGEARKHLEGFADEVRAIRSAVPDLRVTARGWGAIVDGLGHVYERGRRHGERAEREPTPERLHKWRRWTKYHWYHMRLLGDVAPSRLEERRRAAKRLEETLGLDHDLAVLKGLLGDLGTSREATEATRAIVDRRRDALLSAALELGRRLYREEPERFVAEIEPAWGAWRAAAIEPGA
ncbi:MAG: CHAD domain-containing protein [Gemmatimonadota bacterium]|nr:CHAD domain-containing protein [Gemmatimonadota bacterium]